MAFHTNDFETYVVLGDSKAPPLWRWASWRRFAAALDPLIRIARGNPAVRCSQFLPDRGGTVKFGRLGWKESDHQKWAHGSPINKADSKSWRFLDVEVWAPAWTSCEREDRAPDVFVCILNKSLDGSTWTFNPVVVFAVASELAVKEPSLIPPILSVLSTATAPKLFGYRRRPWGLSIGKMGFTNAIQDLAVNGLFKSGRNTSGEVGFHILAEEWLRVGADEMKSRRGAGPK
jgi:hypothetical protein